MPLTGVTINLAIDVIMANSESNLSALKKLAFFDKCWENQVYDIYSDIICRWGWG